MKRRSWRLSKRSGSIEETACRDWTLLDKRVERWQELWSTERWPKIKIGVRRERVLSDPEIEQAIKWGCEWAREDAKRDAKGGWTFPSPEEHWNQGYPQEIADFVSCIAEDREPASGFMLARDVTIVLYAAYVSAEEGRRVDLGPLLG